MGEWELYEIIKDSLPSGMEFNALNTINITGVDICSIVFEDSGDDPVFDAESNVILQDTFSIKLVINGNSTPEGVEKASKWSNEARKEVLKLCKYTYFELDDTATEEMKNIGVPKELNVNEYDPIVWLGDTLYNLGYEGNVKWLYIDRVEPIKNVQPQGRNEQDIPWYIIEFIIHYNEGVIENG